VKANLYTIAPNLSGGVFIVLVCWLSDKTQQRAICAIVSVAISAVGFICLGTVDITHHTGLGYFLYTTHAIWTAILLGADQVWYISPYFWSIHTSRAHPSMVVQQYNLYKWKSNNFGFDHWPAEYCGNYIIEGFSFPRCPCKECFSQQLY
jgi:hypothetical protein